ncbi:MAG: rubredoxin [Lachnospiraceae bacterium]|nr:rubredoxin [Lachnospiraceae bacterium]
MDKAAKYQCGPCGYIYDPEKGDLDSGIAPGTAFEDLPDDWCCPVCGVSKDMFEKVYSRTQLIAVSDNANVLKLRLRVRLIGTEKR